MAAPTVLCLASEVKGQDFIREFKRLGGRVVLITEQARADGDWPRDHIDQFHLMPSLARQDDVRNGVSYLARETAFDAIVALDDYDVEMAAALREHLRLPGMSSSQARFVRDKLAMRLRAAEAGIPVPPFTGLFNHAAVARFLAETPAPWLLKPRAEAGAVGIQRLRRADEVWEKLAALGDRQSFYLLEQFVPGDIFHVDAIVVDGAVRFATVHQYGRPPLAVSHDGGVFTTSTVPRDDATAVALRDLNARLVAALGLTDGVAHAEYIRGHADGVFYFLEIGARVGGANIAETVEAATGVNLWRAWAGLLMARLRGEPYEVPADRGHHAAIILCLAGEKHVDTSAYDDPEIVWRMRKDYHAGLIIAAPDAARVQALRDSYVERFAGDFLAVGQAKTDVRTYTN